MIYKSLFLLVFANMFNQAYQMQNITCPKWVPGTNEILPHGVTLSPELELKNRELPGTSLVTRTKPAVAGRAAKTSEWGLNLRRSPILNFLSTAGNPI